MFGCATLRRLVERQTEALNDLLQAITHLQRDVQRAARQAAERDNKIMAGQQELEDALRDLSTTLEGEIGQINQKLDDLRSQVAPDLQPQVDEIRAITNRIQGIVEDAQPEP